MAKSWREKLENPPKGLPKVVSTSSHPKMEKRFGKGKMLIATPSLVDELIREVGKGELITPKQIMERLAKDFSAKGEKVDFVCPMTTGIFINICARAAEEDRAAGLKEIAPYWRVIKSDGSLNEKFPGGVEAHAKLLREEGFVVEKPSRGHRPRIGDFEIFLRKR